MGFYVHQKLNYVYAPGGGNSVLENSKIRIYDLNYVLYDLVDRYQSKGVVFPNQNISLQQKQNITREALNALLYGIPYPQVYVSELQNGQLLVLETDNRLRCLIEFIVGKFTLEMSVLSLGSERYYDLHGAGERMKFAELNARDRQDILRSKIPVCIIEYETPLYMHLRIGAYVGNWSVGQEEAIRRVLYADRGIFVLQEALRINPKTHSGLMIEAEFVVFLTYIVNFVFYYHGDCKEDQYYMQEIALNYVDSGEFDVERLAHVYIEARKYLTDAAFYNRYGTGRMPLFRIFSNRFSNIKPARGHILGMAACLCADIYDVQNLVEKAYRIMQRICVRDYDTEMEVQLRNSDLSNISLERIINEFRRFL